MATLIYIGGYGRSGSTLLEYLMTANPKLVACGEVASCLRTTRKSRCTCRQPVKECPVWDLFFSPSSQASGWTHRNLTLALLEHVSGDYQLMVDSSKTAWASMGMPFRLKQRLGQNFHLIHIVRDPRAVCWSLIQGERKSPALYHRTLRCVSSTIGWYLANLGCEFFRLFYSAQYVRVRYEDLARSPDEVLQKLFSRLLPDIPWDPEAIGNNNNRHQLHGNRMRKRQLSIRTVQEDIRWRNEMPLSYRRLVATLSWLLRSRYRYS